MAFLDIGGGVAGVPLRIFPPHVPLPASGGGVTGSHTQFVPGVGVVNPNGFQVFQPPNTNNSQIFPVSPPSLPPIPPRFVSSIPLGSNLPIPPEFMPGLLHSLFFNQNPHPPVFFPNLGPISGNVNDLGGRGPNLFNQVITNTINRRRRILGSVFE